MISKELREKLEEAAERYAIGMFDEVASHAGFIAGAEWMLSETTPEADINKLREDGK